MELSWAMKLRIAAAAAVGVVLIGILAWPVTMPSETSGAIDFSGAVTLLALALLAGFIGFFVSCLTAGRSGFWLCRSDWPSGQSGRAAWRR